MKRRPWTEDLVDEDVLNFHCEGERYFVCDDVDDIRDKLENSEHSSEEMCGLRVECTNTTSNGGFVDAGFIARRPSNGTLWIEVGSCGHSRYPRLL